MNLLRHNWDPWRELERMRASVHPRMDTRWWSMPFAEAEYPAVNLWQNEEATILTAELPGFAPEDLDVTVKGNLVTLSGRRREEGLEENQTFVRRERTTEQFSRIVQLPFEVDPAQTEAAYNKGVLTLALHRPQELRPKKIAITAG